MPRRFSLSLFLVLYLSPYSPFFFCCYFRCSPNIPTPQSQLSPFSPPSTRDVSNVAALWLTCLRCFQIGGSLAKLVYFTRELDSPDNGGRLNFINFFDWLFFFNFFHFLFLSILGNLNFVNFFNCFYFFNFFSLFFFSNFLNNFNKLFLDLLRKIFVYDPKKRITAREALRHPWFGELVEDDGTEAGRIRVERERLERERETEGRGNRSAGYGGR